MIPVGDSSAEEPRWAETPQCKPPRQCKGPAPAGCLLEQDTTTDVCVGPWACDLHPSSSLYSTVKAQKCDRFSWVVFSTTERGSQKVERNVFGKLSTRCLQEHPHQHYWQSFLLRPRRVLKNGYTPLQNQGVLRYILVPGTIRQQVG